MRSIGVQTIIDHSDFKIILMRVLEMNIVTINKYNPTKR